jgi:hypothetical protein
MVAFNAEVSKKGMLSWSANSFMILYSTTLLVVRSHLFPTSSLLTPSEAYRSISCSHCSWKCRYR